MPDIRKGDEVLVLTGKDAGKKGTVQRVVTNPQGWKKTTAKLRRRLAAHSPLAGASVVVEGLNIAKRHTKPRQVPVAPTASRASSRAASWTSPSRSTSSNVMVICPACSQPTRIRHDHAADGRSVRVCGNCGEPLARAERNRS